MFIDTSLSLTEKRDCFDLIDSIAPPAVAPSPPRGKGERLVR
jgi:hypothetical protein